MGVNLGSFFVTMVFDTALHKIGDFIVDFLCEFEGMVGQGTF
jgi:hypothetical protein